MRSALPSKYHRLRPQRHQHVLLRCLHRNRQRLLPIQHRAQSKRLLLPRATSLLLPRQPCPASVTATSSRREKPSRCDGCTCRCCCRMPCSSSRLPRHVGSSLRRRTAPRRSPLFPPRKQQPQALRCQRPRLQRRPERRLRHLPSPLHRERHRQRRRRLPLRLNAPPLPHYRRSRERQPNRETSLWVPPPPGAPPPRQHRPERQRHFPPRGSHSSPSRARRRRPLQRNALAPGQRQTRPRQSHLSRARLPPPLPR